MQQQRRQRVSRRDMDSLQVLVDLSHTRLKLFTCWCSLSTGTLAGIRTISALIHGHIILLLTYDRKCLVHLLGPVGLCKGECLLSMAEQLLGVTIMAFTGKQRCSSSKASCILSSQIGTRAGGVGQVNWPGVGGMFWSAKVLVVTFV